MVPVGLDALGRGVHFDVDRRAPFDLHDKVPVPLTHAPVGPDAERRQQRFVTGATLEADLFEHGVDPQIRWLARPDAGQGLHLFGKVVGRRQLAVSARDLHQQRARGPRPRFAGFSRVDGPTTVASKGVVRHAASHRNA